MGSWSVYCTISNIAITSGNKCVLVPLKEAKGHEGIKWQPATFPIFGEYNDYGGIENIEQNDNTKLIEKHFGITIDEFASFLVDGKFTYYRDEAKKVAVKVKNFTEAENLRFTWIDRNVYDFMIQDMDTYHKGYNDYGTPEFLKLFGFELVEGAKCKNYDSKRFNQLWKKGDTEFYSDGSTLLTTKKDRFVYHFGKNDESSLETYFDVPEEFQYLKNVNKVNTWRLYDKKDCIEMFGSILGNRFESSLYDMEMLMERIGRKIVDAEGGDINTLVELPLHRQYMNDLETYGDSFVELYHMMSNLYVMSGLLRPMDLYATPQCGEYARHQKLLDKFAEINRSYIDEDEEDE